MTATDERAEPTPLRENRRLRGRLGAGAIVLMVIAAAAPLSVIGGQVPLGFILGNGVGMPSMFVVAGVILLLFAVGFTHMTKFVPKTGAFFIYISYGLAKPLGLGAAYVSIFSYLCIEIGLVGYLGSAASDVVASAGGPVVPWWIYALVALALVGLIGLRNIGLSSKVLGVLLILEISVVIVLALVVTFTGGAEGLSAAPFVPSNVLSGAPALGLMFALAAFLGFESTAIFRDEAKDPKKTIPRATYIAIIAVGVFYAFSSWAMVMAWGPDDVVAAAQENPATLILLTAERYLGPFAVVVINVLLFTSVLAAMLSFHNVVTRYLHSLGSTGLLPARLSAVHNGHDSPSTASLVTSAVGVVIILFCGLLGLDGATQVLAWTSGVATLGITTLMAVTAVAVIVFFLRSRLDRNPWRTLIAPAIGAIGLLAASVVIALNFPLLVGDMGADGSPAFGATSIILLLLPVPFLVTGIVQALVVRRNDRMLYDAITEVDVELV